MSAIRVLAVDDNSDALFVLEDILKREGYEVYTAGSGTETLAQVKEHEPHIILLDVQMPGPDGYEVTRLLKSNELYRYIPIILLTAKDELSDIVHGFEQGADDYIKKPYNERELLSRLRAALRTRSLYESLKATINENIKLSRAASERHSFSHIIGQSQAMDVVFRTIEKIAPSDAPVLITGESGTGKELVAQAIHYASPRKNKPFIAQNVSAFNDNLLESELFGHAKGAFTGAIKDKQGLFEAANGGSLFLDELGEMSASMQAKLLRVMQDGTFTSVGDTKSKKVDVRVIAATHRDVSKMVREGAFREDLYYRLNVVQIELPPLRNRAEDVPLLAEFFLTKALQRYGQSVKRLSPDVLKILTSYTWPGNVRQLQNAIERLVLMSGNDTVITSESLSKDILDGASKTPLLHGDSGKLKDAVEALERAMIDAALKKHEYNKSEVARELGVSRSNLISKVQSYGLDKK